MFKVFLGKKRSILIMIFLIIVTAVLVLFFGWELKFSIPSIPGVATSPPPYQKEGVTCSQLFLKSHNHGFSTFYMFLDGNCGVRPRQVNSPKSGVCKDLTVDIVIPPGIRVSWVIQLLSGEEATALSCTIADNNTSCKNFFNKGIIRDGDYPIIQFIATGNGIKLPGEASFMMNCKWKYGSEVKKYTLTRTLLDISSLNSSPN